MDKKKLIYGASLVLPTLLLCGAVVISLINLNSAPSVRLPITGFDPVDLLRGHYLRFRFDPSALEDRPKYFEHTIGQNKYCLCFQSIPAEANGQDVKAKYVSCANKPKAQCDYWSSNIGFFDPVLSGFDGGRKYFVDENYAYALDKLVRQIRPQRNEEREPVSPVRATMEVAISSSGALRLKMLYIDNKPWMEAISTSTMTSP